MLKRIIKITTCVALLFLTGCISVNPITLNFDSNETTKTFTLIVLGPVEWSIECSESWVSFNPDKGQGEGTYSINVTVDRRGLNIGNYGAILSISTNPKLPCPGVKLNVSVSDIVPVPSEVTGYVYEYGTSNTISGVSVSIGAKSNYSDSDGYYSISNVLTGSYTITASKEGYNDYNSTIDVIDDYTEYDIYMMPELPPAPTVVISANPPAVKKGGSTTLYWVSTNATSVSITPDIGKVSVTGSYEVKEIDSTTTYIITAEGPGGQTLASIKVTVQTALPTVELSAIPSTIEEGQSTTLLWASDNANSAFIDHGIGPVNAPGGSLEVFPPESVTYTITVQGAYGTASASTTVTVLEPFETAIRVLIPNGGETWVPATEEKITWAATQTITNVKIELLYSETSIYTIANSTPNDGEHSFTLLPGMLPENLTSENNTSFRIRITDPVGSTTYDKSDRPFTITPYPGIYVETPGTLFAGQSGEINWKASSVISNVKIELIHTDDNSGNETISPVADSVSSSLSTFTWENIPDDAIGRSNRIKIYSVDDETVFDICDKDFDVLDGDALSLTHPDGGEVWHIGSCQIIEWLWSGDVSEVDIKMTVDDGFTYHTITENEDNTGSFEVLSFGEGWLDDHTLWTTPVLEGLVLIVSSNNAEVWSESADYFEIPITLGILYDKILAARGGPDSDGDRLPDSIEEFLGTDPDLRDTDGDGIHDYNEIFGFGYFDSYAPLPDLNSDGIIAPNDAEERDDDIDAWFTADNDDDGIPNYLEYYGYTYDWMSDTYALWDGMSFDEPYYKTDPLQPSTDQDPYSDAMESSGNLMDVLVHSPGDLPMVPAYPNIVVKLEGYVVTLNGEITYGEGGSLATETTWNRETGTEESTTWTHGWEVGGTVKLGKEPGVEMSGSYSGNWSSTNTTRSTSSRGGSITSEQNWQKATSSNPAAAGRVKLKLKVYNYGTSAASSILPTLTLKIGGMNVLTFQPANPINILEPGGVYPPQEGTYWVVEKVESMDTEPYIHITIEELRALECGAPVTVDVTQMSADVMLMSGEGQWESAGPWSEYMARCEAVCSNMLLEIDNGTFIHYLVYSDDALTSPMVTFKDALTWVAGAHTTDNNTLISYRDQFGIEKTMSLDGWHFTFDSDTLLNNGFTFVDDQTLQAPGPEFNMDNLVLGPDTTIIGKVPRQAIDDTGPEIHYAYLDEKKGWVVTCASDYRGIAGATFVDKDGVSYPMYEAIYNSGIYSFSTYSINDAAYESGCSEDLCPEKVIVTSTDNITAEVYVSRLEYQEKDPVPPEILSVSFNLSDGLITANINEDKDFPCRKVWAYHHKYKEDGVDMSRSQEFWDPNEVTKWYGYIPANWELSADEIPDLTVIAEVDENHEYYDTKQIGSSITCSDCEQGDGSVYTLFNFYVAFWDFKFHGIDFDIEGTSVKRFQSSYDGNTYNNQLGKGYEAIWATKWGGDASGGENVLYFDTEWVRWSDIDPSATSVDPADIANIQDDEWNDPGIAWSGNWDVDSQVCTNGPDVLDTYVLKAGESDRYIVFEVTEGACRFWTYKKSYMKYRYIIY